MRVFLWYSRTSSKNVYVDAGAPGHYKTINFTDDLKRHTSYRQQPWKCFTQSFSEHVVVDLCNRCQHHANVFRSSGSWSC